MDREFRDLRREVRCLERRFRRTRSDQDRAAWTRRLRHMYAVLREKGMRYWEKELDKAGCFQTPSVVGVVFCHPWTLYHPEGFYRTVIYSHVVPGFYESEDRGCSTFDRECASTDLPSD